MPRRSRKNGRFTKTSRRRTRKKNFNISKAVETGLVANAAIHGLFGTNLPTFLTGRDIAGGFGANGNNNSWEITGPELLNMLFGGTGGVHKDFTYDGEKGLMAAIRKNIKDNGLSALGQMVLLPMAFRFGRKVLAKPLINPTNRALKNLGIKEVKL